MNLKSTQFGKTPVVIGNISDTVDMSVIRDEILNVHNTVFEGKSGEELTYDYYGRYDILELVPSLNFLPGLIKECLILSGYDPSVYKFKAWFNVCYESEHLNWHGHETTNHGYMVVSNNGTKTRFKGFEPFVLENKVGQVVNLNGRYQHAVEPNRSPSPRITVAWDTIDADIVTERLYYPL